MRSLVCVKWVPVLAALRFDAATRRLVREGVRGEVSAFDVRALGCATALRAVHGGRVEVVTMGGPGARAGLVECLALGADRGIHLADAALAGSDTLATARALAAVVRREMPDLVLLGRASMDAETGQVGPELAALLDWPLATQVRRLRLDPPAGTFEAECEVDDGYETRRGPLPAVITVAEDVAEERFPSKAEREAAAGRSIDTLDLAAIGLAPAEVGAAGSPTWVADVVEVTSQRRGETLTGNEPTELAQRLRERLLALGALGDGAAAAVAAPPPRRRPEGDPLWVVVESGRDGAVRRVTAELLGKAVRLAATLGGEVQALVMDGDERQADALAAAGADRVLLLQAPGLVPFAGEAHATALATAIARRRPRLVLLGSTARGREVAPRVAAQLGLGLTGDAIDLDVDAEGRIRQLKPAFGGAVVAPILSRTRPEMATVRPGLLGVAPPDRSRSAVVERLALSAVASRVTVCRHEPVASEAGDVLDAARVVLGVGMGVGEAGVPAVAALARRLGAGLAATRDVTDAGWLPRQHQVGITGRAVAPRLYVGLGVRGAMEHMVGLRRAGVIVAVNHSPKAPIMKQADLCVVADLHALLPYLEAALAS